MTVLRRRSVAILVAALLTALATAASAGAAGRSIPSSFFGAVWDGKVTKGITLDTRDQVFGQMAMAGVESIRTNFDWARAQTKPGGAFDFRITDSLVSQAGAHGLDVLPVVILAPDWARRDKFTDFSPPRDPNEYAAYLTALIGRYGPDGSFWTLHPELTPRPIRDWQVWNEPHLPYQWTIPRKEDYARGYGRLLRVAYRAVKKADPGANVVLAGLANSSPSYLAHLYQKGHIKGYYDLAAIHPYTRKPSGVLELIQRFRTVMRKNHDSLKPVWVTELGLPSSKGRVKSKNYLQTTDKGMAKFLTGSYRALVKRYLSVQSSTARVYWYDWASRYKGGNIFNYTGLYTWDGHSGFTERKALAAYRASAQKYEGCVKTAAGVCEGTTSP
ncbi:MAG: polysaccharide biosynthesis protein PslG [Thermoleophilaceae bacterium]|nr:polysaccharide biosynthesis protein PslG [Thermoleophilaceae bacterium]